MKVEIEKKTKVSLGEECSVASMDYNESIKKISIGDENGNLHILQKNDNDDGKKFEACKIHIQNDTCILDHKWLNRTHLIYTDLNKVKIFDVQKEKTISVYNGHQKHVLCLKNTPTESYFLSGGDDSCLFAWDTRNVKPSNFIFAHSSSITSIDITKDASVVLTTSDEGYGRTWDINDGICLSTSMLSNSPAVSFGKFFNNPRYCLFSCLDGRSEIFDTKRGVSIAKFDGYENSDFLIESDFIKNSTGLITGFVIGSENGYLNFFDFESKKIIQNVWVSEVGGTVDFVKLDDKNVCYTTGRNFKHVEIYELDISNG